MPPQRSPFPPSHGECGQTPVINPPNAPSHPLSQALALPLQFLSRHFTQQIPRHFCQGSAYTFEPRAGYVIAALPKGGGAEGVFALSFCAVPNEHDIFRTYAVRWHPYLPTGIIPLVCINKSACASSRHRASHVVKTDTTHRYFFSRVF